MRSILLVEDEDDNRELTSLSLRRKGYTVEPAASVAEAVAALERMQPDVMIIDLGLPDGHGADVVERAQQLGFTPPPLLIALTGHSQADVPGAARVESFDHHLVKPTSVATLCKLIEAHAPGSSQG